MRNPVKFLWRSKHNPLHPTVAYAVPEAGASQAAFVPSSQLPSVSDYAKRLAWWVLTGLVVGLLVGGGVALSVYLAPVALPVSALMFAVLWGAGAFFGTMGLFSMIDSWRDGWPADGDWSTRAFCILRLLNAALWISCFIGVAVLFSSVLAPIAAFFGVSAAFSPGLLALLVTASFAVMSVLSLVVGWVLPDREPAKNGSFQKELNALEQCSRQHKQSRESAEDVDNLMLAMPLDLSEAMTTVIKGTDQSDLEGNVDQQEVGCSSPEINSGIGRLADAAQKGELLDEECQVLANAIEQLTVGNSTAEELANSLESDIQNQQAWDSAIEGLKIEAAQRAEDAVSEKPSQDEVSSDETWGAFTTRILADPDAGDKARQSSTPPLTPVKNDPHCVGSKSVSRALDFNGFDEDAKPVSSVHGLFSVHQPLDELADVPPSRTSPDQKPSQNTGASSTGTPTS